MAYQCRRLAVVYQVVRLVVVVAVQMVDQAPVKTHHQARVVLLLDQAVVAPEAFLAAT